MKQTKNIISLKKSAKKARQLLKSDTMPITKSDKISHMMKGVTHKDHKYVSVALDAAKNSDMLMKHGCVIVESNRIIGTGWNMMRNQFKDNFIGVSCSCHAEMYALRQALRAKTKGKSSPFRKRTRSCLRCEKEA